MTSRSCSDAQTESIRSFFASGSRKSGTIIIEYFVCFKFCQGSRNSYVSLDCHLVVFLDTVCIKVRDLDEAHFRVGYRIYNIVSISQTDHFEERIG